MESGDEDLNMVEEEEKDEETTQVSLNALTESNFESRMSEPTLSLIKPVPTQLLTVFIDQNNTVPIHLEMDSGANLNYVHINEVLKYNYKIKPNGQLSTLGDGVSKIKAVGEIDETYFRNNFKV